MSNAEEYIKKHTKALKESNGEEYFNWLTPDDARRAVEIAREELIEWLSYHLNTSKIDVDYKFEVIEELRKAMKDGSKR